MKKLAKGIGVVGSTTIDKIVAGDQIYFKQGGVTTYAGHTYRRHGIPTRIVSNLAEKDSKIIERSDDAKIDVHWKKSDQTTHFVNYVQSSKRRQEITRLAEPIENRQIQKICHKVDGLHLGPLHPLDIDPSVLRELLKSRLAVFLDIQGYTRMVENQAVYPRISDHLKAGLKLSKMIKANGFEYQLMLDHYQMNLAEIMNRFNIEETVITLGEKGGFIQKKDGELVEYLADVVKFPVDSTGAGDVFFAAYITSRFKNEMRIPDACRYAARVAARQVEGIYISINQLEME